MEAERVDGGRNECLSRPRFEMSVKECVLDWIWWYNGSDEGDEDGDITQNQTTLASQILTSHQKLLFEEQCATSFVESVKGSIVPAPAFIVAMWPCSMDHSPYVKHSKPKDYAWRLPQSYKRTSCTIMFSHFSTTFHTVGAEPVNPPLSANSRYAQTLTALSR